MERPQTSCVALRLKPQPKPRSFAWGIATGLTIMSVLTVSFMGANVIWPFMAGAFVVSGRLFGDKVEN